MTLRSRTRSFVRRWLLAAPLALFTTAAVAQGPKPFVAAGDPNAKVGGSLTMRIDQYPRSLNYYTGGDVYGGLLAALLLPRLGFQDYETRAFSPYVAKNWELAADKLSLTVELDERAKWSDGTPLTADDVLFTWDAIFDPKNDTADNRGFLDGIEKWEKTGPTTVKFKFARVHFTNVDRVLSLYLIEKSQYTKGGKNFNKDFNDEIFGAGPYKFDDKATKKNRKVVMKRDATWWGWQLPWSKGLYNFDTISLNVIQDDRVAFESFKKGELSWLEFRAAMFETWVKETGTPQFQGNPLVKASFPRANPVDNSGIVLNMRRPPLDNIKFREAMQLLFNRQLFVEKIYYNLQEAQRGPFGLYSPYASPNLKVPEFNPTKASALLKELGYTKADSDGILFKEEKGQKQRAEITIMYAYAPHEKYLTIFKEDARKVGVAVNLKFTEWAPMMKLVEQFKFDAITMGWSGDPEPAPEQLWLTKFANTPASSNYAGFASAEVDKLIEEAGAVLEPEKRYPFYHKIEELIVAQQPYIWRWSQKDHYFIYNKEKVGVPAKTYKFTGDAYRDPMIVYWWDSRLK